MAAITVRVSKVKNSARFFLTLLAVWLLSSCAARRGAVAPANDPIEGVNRKIFWFNDHVDAYVLEPVATGWAKVAPTRVRTSVANFFDNLRFPIVTVNDLLQAKPLAAGEDVARFGVNTTVGVLGFFDPATGWGLDKHEEDFGQTLGVWGVPGGPYVVIPLLGPSNLRDAAGLCVDYALSVTPFFVDEYILVGAQVVNAVDQRSLVLDEVREAKRSAFDYYVFVRDAYAQRRNALVEDSQAPSAATTEELYHPEGEWK
jgi:phospholipid-binding lipoprotein MlaA